jgi:O-6-methylguanine DNA methyltransferase
VKQQATFREKIYILTKQIPDGKVATYGQLAQLAGSPGAARAVGMCMRTNAHPEIVPCYKVVASDGSLTGYSAGKGIITKKEKLLHDGVSFIGDKVNLKKSLWQKV